ncbi:MAG: ATP-binding protein [Chloroflexi bacterium]|nr:ATP-binding protein [Chloroflexota bacterium]
MILSPRSWLGVALLAALLLLAVVVLPRWLAALAAGASVFLLALLGERFALQVQAPDAPPVAHGAVPPAHGAVPPAHGAASPAHGAVRESPAAQSLQHLLLDHVQAILDPLPQGVVLLDDGLLVLAANPALARLVGQPLDGMLGASLIRATRDYGLTTCARERPAQPRDVQLAGGPLVRVSAASLDPPLLGGRATLALLVEDRTALRVAQQARTDLVANLSHELRTPIAGARAIAETLQTPAVEPAERERFLRLLVDELERMSELVQRMLRLAQLESEREPLDLEVVSAAQLLESAAQRFAPVASTRGVRVELATVEPAEVLANRERAAEVLASLLDNALRHSPPGASVGLAAFVEDGVGAAGSVRFEVRDEGPGILPQERERVFERFYTGDAARESGSHTGLGLAIARQLVQQQGGRIWVADRAPGATLCFTLQRVADADARTGEAPA